MNEKTRIFILGSVLAAELIRLIRGGEIRGPRPAEGQESGGRA